MSLYLVPKAYGRIEFRNGTLLVEREPNQLDELAIAFSEIPDRFDVDVEMSDESEAGSE